MDSFADHSITSPLPLDDIRQQVRQQEADLAARGIKSSGRVLHACHYIPVTSSYSSSAADLQPLSPPQTPPTKLSDVPTSPVDAAPASDHNPLDPSSPWSFSPRYGHAAMISGVMSLAATHEQVIIGWTGDISNTRLPETIIPSNSISKEDRAGLEKSLQTYQPRESDPDDDRKTTYVPVWLDDKEAHGHYEGYCKQSMFRFHFAFHRN